MDEQMKNAFSVGKAVAGFDDLDNQGDMRVMRVDLPDGKGMCVSGRVRTNPDNLIFDIEKVWIEMEEIRRKKY